MIRRNHQNNMVQYIIKSTNILKMSRDRLIVPLERTKNNKKKRKNIIIDIIDLIENMKIKNILMKNKRMMKVNREDCLDKILTSLFRDLDVGIAFDK